MNENNITNTTDTVQKCDDSNSVLCLLVDDITLNLNVLAAMVKKLGCVPVVVNSAKEALFALAEHKFHLILTDLWMPEMNGMEFAKIVRQNPDYHDIPIIAVTADSECESNFDMTFFDGFLIKPITFEDLQTGLQRHHL